MPLVQRIVEERIGSDPLAGKNRQLFGRRNRAQYLMHEEAQPQTIMPTSIGPVGMPDISTLMTR